jgi:hypothetical protein
LSFLPLSGAVALGQSHALYILPFPGTLAMRVREQGRLNQGAEEKVCLTPLLTDPVFVLSSDLPWSYGC